MQAFLHIAEFDTLLDVLAIACSLMMIFFLLCNRFKYGRILLNAKHAMDHTGFAGQVSVQMMSQQSQKAFDNLQRSLSQEFESLRLLGEGYVSDKTITDRDHFDTPLADMGNERRRRYRLAEEMFARGDDVQQISQQCGLAEGELELLQGLQQLARGDAFKP
jgi:hypothetical protein